jgi:hypothetical protein
MNPYENHRWLRESNFPLIKIFCFIASLPMTEQKVRPMLNANSPSSTPAHCKSWGNGMHNKFGGKGKEMFKEHRKEITCIRVSVRPPLWSSDQSSWLQIQRSRVRFSVLLDFLRSSGCGTGSTQPRECSWGTTWKKKNRHRYRKPRIRLRDPWRSSRAPSIRKKFILTSPTSGGRLVGIVN